MIRDGLRRGLRRVGRSVRRRLGSTVVPVDGAPVDVQSAVVEGRAPTSPFDASGAREPEPEPVVRADEGGQDGDSDASEGPPMTLETVAALFEDMVRPALQSDGGDIDLVHVDAHDVHVRLTGACSTCPSSTITMKMGIERLLEEEFPQFQRLVQVP